MEFQAGRRVRLSMAAFLFAAVAGCGGGGGGGVVPPPPPAPPVAEPLVFGIHPSAAVVLGQPHFDTIDAGDALDRFSFPFDTAATEDGRLIVSDGRNDKLKTFSSYDSTPTGRAADFEVALFAPAISTAGSRVVTARGVNVRIFDSWPTTAGPLEPVVTSTGRVGCFADALRDASAAYITPLGRLIVADKANHRVLIWNSIPAKGDLPAAHIVIGQPHMETCNENAGDGDTPGATGRGGLSLPHSVWSDDTRLIVSDHGNNRVLIWNTFPATFQEPDHVVGQANFQDSAPNAGGQARGHTLERPGSVDVNEHGQLAVADTGNNRVLIWNSIPDSDGKAADQVIGQPMLDGSGWRGASEKSLFAPYTARFHKRNLIVTEPENSRVMIFRSE